MNRSDFLKMVQEKMKENGEESYSVTELNGILTGFSDAIRQVIANNDSIRFGNVGTFAGVHRDARTGRNPSTGESIEIPAREGYPKFKFSATTKNDSKE